MSFVEYAYPISPCGLTHPPAALCAYMPCGSILCPMASEFRLRRTVASCGELYDVLCGRRVLGQIQLSNGSPAARWAWMLASKYHEGRCLPTATRRPEKQPCRRSPRSCHMRKGPGD